MTAARRRTPKSAGGLFMVAGCVQLDECRRSASYGLQPRSAPSARRLQPAAGVRNLRLAGFLFAA